MPEFKGQPIIDVSRKEFASFFATPAAYLFIGTFLAVSLFLFFWVEKFYSRNIADIRPLFQWMPLLLIFLVAALTMRSWSEERRSGTLESLLTSPTSTFQLVLGKFIAALSLVSIALLLTLPLPITVAILGPLDWGPVIGGYIAALFLAGAYISIGLYCSSRTDNPVVSLILTAAVGSLFYLIGSHTLTSLLSYGSGSLLKLIGSGSRFESITRGVIDLRDLYYYLSIIGVFLTLNISSLEQFRWAGNPPSERHRNWQKLIWLISANFIAVNLCLAPIKSARLDLTQDHRYSLSQATELQLNQLQEPLLIRAYFSAKTHNLLAPLIPEIQSLLAEYTEISTADVRVEIVDPTSDAAAEDEAASKYGIRPIPFQIADRYQTAVVNSYFDIVIAYGDQYVTLGFNDLIEVKSQSEQDLEVVLKNPEYEITRAIKQVVGEFRAESNLYQDLPSPVIFHAYVSPQNKLPESLQVLKEKLDIFLAKQVALSDNKLELDFVDPENGTGELAKELESQYGFVPQMSNLFDPEPFWFYMVLENGASKVQIPLPESLEQADLQRAIEAALKRLAPGVLKTIAVLKPPVEDSSSHRYSQLDAILGESFHITQPDLSNGHVPEDTDLLLVLAPSDLDLKQQFAIDQFLMQGGNVILATSPLDVEIHQGLNAVTAGSGLEAWLNHHGINIPQTMVLDPINASLPVPVERNIGGLPVQEIRMLPYPHFPDLRGKQQLNPHSPITNNLDQLTLNWVSPIEIDKNKIRGRQVTWLLRSSEESWTSDELNLLPDYASYPDNGFAISPEQKPYTLAIVMEGSFESYWKDKVSPLLEENDAATASAQKHPDTLATEYEQERQVIAPQRFSRVIQRSPKSSRLIIIASNSFATDTAIDLASQALNTFYAKPLDFLQNTVDWSVEDSSLLALRGRSQLTRTLSPMSNKDHRFWEALNYLLALAGVLGIWFLRRRITRKNYDRYRAIISEV